MNKPSLKLLSISLAGALVLPGPAAAQSMRVRVAAPNSQGGSFSAAAVRPTLASPLGSSSFRSALGGTSLKGSAAPRLGAAPSAVPAGISAPLSLPDSALGTVEAAPGSEARGQGRSYEPGAVEAASASLEDSAPLLRDRTDDPMDPTLPVQPQRSLFSRMVKAVKGWLAPTAGLVPSYGGGMGILPQRPPVLPNGSPLDEAPVAPDPAAVSGISFNSFDVPGALNTGPFDNGPVVLQADPASETSVETALRAMVDAKPTQYGIASSGLTTVHVRRVAGVGNQASTIYAYFRQQRNNVPVHGSYLSFTVKEIGGKAVLMASMAKLYPNMDVETQARFPDEELKRRAEERVGIPPNSPNELEFLEQKIIYSQGGWHAANLYTMQGMPFMIAVDVATGEVFVWNARLGVQQDGEAAGSVKGRIEGKGVATGPTRDNSTLTQVPMPYLNVSISGGKSATTDVTGKFSATSASGKAEATAVLSGKFAVVTDSARNPLKVQLVLTPSGETVAVFDPSSVPAEQREQAIAQVNAYVQVNTVHEWLKNRGVQDSRLDKPIPVNTNIDDECNAYYTPGRPSLNFFKSSANCSNSAYDSVVFHEYGHFVDDMLGGIVHGGLSEGWGDILSMYITGNPIVGEGFLKQGERNYIRDGKNDYQYQANDEVHDQGQAWMGFGWKLRKSLVEALGEAGAAVAEALVVPTLFAKAADIPAAMAQVLLNAMDKDGVIQHEALIRAAAKAHGIELPKSPSGIAKLAAEGFSSGLTGLNGQGSPDA